MAFLTKQELKTKRREDVINVITNYDDNTVTEVIEQEIGVFKDALANYDVDTIFSQEGDQRHKTILKHIKSCIVFELYCIRASQYDEVLKGQHDEAMNWLEKVSAGKINTALPLVPNDTDGEHSGFLKLGSRKPYQNKF
jgi:phage gp36-like protein